MAEARSSGLSPLTGLVRPPALEHLAIALDVRPGGEQLHAVGARLELAHRGRRDAHDVPRAQLDDLLVDLHAAGPGEDDVHLLGLPVAVAEPGSLAGVHAVVADADPVRADVLAHVAGLA